MHLYLKGVILLARSIILIQALISYTKFFSLLQIHLTHNAHVILILLALNSQGAFISLFGCSDLMQYPNSPHSFIHANHIAH